MSARTASRLSAFVPSLTDVAFLMPVVFVFLHQAGPRYLLGDGDTGWHIRAGEWMLEHGRIVREDIFSFTRPGEPWFAWEWLWDVAFAWLHQQLGMQAVMLANLLLLAVCCALLYRLTRSACGNVVIAIVVTFLAAAGSAIHWLARPHLFTLLFVTLFYAVLESARQSRIRLLWTLPPMTVLWTNLHGGFFIGVLLIVAYAAGELVSSLLEPDPRLRSGVRARIRPYLWAAAGCLAASLVNPYGYLLHVHIARYVTDPFAFNNIAEFLPMSFHHAVGLWVEAMVLAGAVAAVWSAWRRRFTHALLIAVWAHLALLSARNVPIFLILAAPGVALTATEFLAILSRPRTAAWVRRAVSGVGAYAAKLGSIDRAARFPVASGLAGAALVLLLFLPAGPALLRAHYDPARYPVQAVTALRPGADRVFTDDEWGDYLIYRLFPHGKVFVDGRSDFYGAKFEEEYLEVLRGAWDWQRTLDRYRVDTVLLPVKASLASTLKESKRWRVVHDDGIAIVFRSTAPPAETAMAPVPPPDPARTDGGLPAIARSPISTPVIRGSRSYARR